MEPHRGVADLVGDEIIAGLAGTRFGRVEIHESVDSTQNLLISQGGPDGSVAVADYQTSGRGRAGREWQSPSGRSLLFSVLLHPAPVDQAPLVTLALSVAVANALRSLVGLDAELKWPNDVLVDGRKLCGILAELVPDGYLVVGAGINVAQTRQELPEGVEATSLWLSSGTRVHRGRLLVAVLRELDRLLGSDSWMTEYRARCATVGRRVRVVLPDEVVEGRAHAVRDSGALVVGEREIVAGDVVHLRDGS